MRKILWYIAIFFLLVLLTACTGLPGITFSQVTPIATSSGSHAQGTAEEQQLAQQLFKQLTKTAPRTTFQHWRGSRDWNGARGSTILSWRQGVG